MAILASCPGCSSRFQFDESFAGRPARCAKCQQVFAVPPAPATPAGAAPIAFACGSCQGQLRLAAQFAGQRVRCPLCQQAVLAPPLPGSAPPPAPSVPPPKAPPPAPPPSVAAQPPKAAPSPPPLPPRAKVNRPAPPPAPPPEPAEELLEAAVIEDEPLEGAVIEDEPLEAAVIDEEVITEAQEPPRTRTKARSLPRPGKRLLLALAAGLAFVLVLACGGVWWSFHLESFDDAPRLVRPGTAVRLRQLESMKAPGPAEQMLYSHKHQRLFLRNKDRVRVVDVTTGQSEEPLAAQHEFVDMALSPFEDSLFVADQGEHEAAVAKGKQTVHRYDLRRKRWDARTTPKERETVYERKRVNAQFEKKIAVGTRDVQAVANPMKAVSGSRFLMLPGSGWGRLSLNSWGSGEALREQSKAAPFDHLGHFAYDPRTGRLYYTSFRGDNPPLNAKRVAGAWLLDAQPSSSKSDQDAVRKALLDKGGALMLSTNGKRLYAGRLQFDVNDLSKPLREFPEPIRMATDDLAFSDGQDYYNAETGEKAGEFTPHAHLLAPSLDGSRLWLLDPAAEKLILFAVEGDK